MLVAAVLSIVSVLPVQAQTPAGGATVDDSPAPSPQRAAAFRVLVFTKTAGFRHASIEPGVKAVKQLGDQNNFSVDHTEDANLFTFEYLRNYKVVIFLSTTGDVLNDAQQEALRRYINTGGAWVGVHAAADTEYDWPWYGELAGAYFAGHPQIQEADIIVASQSNPATHHLASRWTRTDEWYNYRAQPREGVSVLLRLDESSYEGGSMGESHPIAWCHEFDGGRAFYTGLGHTEASYAEPEFIEHILGGIQWAANADPSGS